MSVYVFFPNSYSIGPHHIFPAMSGDVVLGRRFERHLAGRHQGCLAELDVRAAVVHAGTLDAGVDDGAILVYQQFVRAIEPATP